MAIRDGQQYLVDYLRDVCMLGTADYTVGTATYWSDDQIEAILKQNLKPVKSVYAKSVSTNIGGTAYYYEYHLPYRLFEDSESGTPYFRLFYSDGEDVSASYTIDPLNGIIYFAADTEGSAVYADLTLYNVSKTASTIWRLKAAHISEHSYDVKLGDHNLSRSQRMQMYLDMSEYYAREGGFNSVPLIRTDITGA